ncbi:nucleoside phosphorylase domain-containing protein [Aspergillus aurantiobrunneus]
MSSFKKRLTRDDYRVGWISALPLEMAAAMAMLDASHVSLPQPRGDHNSYHLGQIGDHNIVIACLPTGVYGITSAAIVAKQMLLSFPSIEVGLMVGIGGGAPSESVDIRLGDIVVSTPTPRFSGVVQYDLGKTLANGVFHRTGTLNRPPDLLLTAVSNLQARHKLGNNNIGVQLEAISKHRDASSKVFAYPGASQDVLFDPTYVHQPDEPSCTTCDRSKAIIRPPRLSTVPCIHYGLIASANQVIKDAQTRDKLANEMGILCYEMEAAGLMDRFPCLVIRGICDYSDSHKDKQWQDYAAAAAAAYARELLEERGTNDPVKTSGLNVSFLWS